MKTGQVKMWTSHRSTGVTSGFRSSVKLYRDSKELKPAVNVTLINQLKEEVVTDITSFVKNQSMSQSLSNRKWAADLR